MRSTIQDSETDPTTRNDFTEAEALLPASWASTLKGRATKNAANGMLGKSLVFRGTVKDVLQRAPSADLQADAKIVSKPINKGVAKVFKKYPVKRK